MRSMSRRWLVAALALSQWGCSTRGREAAGAPRRGGDTITREEIQAGQYANVFDLVQARRFRWLQARGTDIVSQTPGEVQVLLDGTRLGGVQSLRTLAPSDVTSIQFVDPVSAAARWGLGYAHGAILVSMRVPPRS
jgi:hypothetical protein